MGCAKWKGKIQISQSTTHPKNAKERGSISVRMAQIIKEIFLTIDFGQHHFEAFIQYSREVLVGNQKQLNYVDQLA